jgi:hypothetical protein
LTSRYSFAYVSKEPDGMTSRTNGLHDTRLVKLQRRKITAMRTQNQGGILACILHIGLLCILRREQGYLIA